MTFEILHLGPELSKAKNALVILHGRGGTSRSLLSLADACCDDNFYIAAPQAPGKTWYPYSFMAEESLNEPFLSTSIGEVASLIEETAKVIPRENIYLMGFSQGACLILEVAARKAAKYGGIVAFTGGLIGSDIVESHYKGDFAGTKIFMGISERDPHIPLIRAELSKEILQKRGAAVTLSIYEGASHTITEAEIDWVKKNIFNV